MKYRHYVFGIILSLFILGCEQHYGLNSEDITNMYSSYVTEWQDKAKASFDKAEQQTFVINPNPKPDDIVGPNPDVTKCICKGTGIIVQGDGHKTPCPFHHGDVPSQRLPVKK